MYINVGFPGGASGKEWSEVNQSCPTLCDPMDCSLPGSSIHGIFQVRVLEWVAIFLLQGIFLTQGLNLGLPHCRKTLYYGDIRDADSIPGSGRSSGGGHVNPLQYSSLENPMDRGTWQAIVHRVEKSWTRLKQLGTHTCTYVRVHGNIVWQLS